MARVRERYWKKPNRVLFISIVGLLFFGVIAVSSASAVLSFQRYGTTNYFFFRQILFALISLGLMIFFSRFDYQKLRPWTKIIMLAAIVALGVVLIPGIGFSVAGARRWINLGPFLIQPSEFAKIAIILYLAHWFERKEGAENNFWFGILPPLIVVGVAAGLVVLHDLGTTTITLIIAVTILFAANTKLKYFIWLLASGLLAFWFVITASPYRAARITTFLNPEQDPLGIGYHINQALLAIGSGGLLGFGFGASRQKHNFLPEPIGDSIFAVMAEELGFVRVTVLIVVFLVIGFVGYRIAKQAPDKFGRLTAVGITSWIVLQGLVNIGAISGILPLTGITLPFISYGGSSLIALGIAAGILLNISRQIDRNVV